jgi:hypothetical protein
MPGNLEAPRILSEHAYLVKNKLARNPYPTRVLGPTRHRRRPAHQRCKTTQQWT